MNKFTIPKNTKIKQKICFGNYQIILLSGTLFSSSWRESNNSLLKKEYFEMLYELARGIYCINDNSEIVWKIDLITEPSIEAIMEESYSQFTYFNEINIENGIIEAITDTNSTINYEIQNGKLISRTKPIKC